MPIPSAWIGALLATQTDKLPSTSAKSTGATHTAATQITSLPPGRNLPEEKTRPALPYLRINRSSNGRSVTATYHTEGLIHADHKKLRQEFCAWCVESDIPHYIDHQFFETIIVCGISHLDEDDIFEIEMKWT